MNKFLSRAILFLSAPMMMLASCAPEAGQSPPLAGAKIGGEFTLIDQNGGERHYSDFDGQYRIVYFGYTSCPDICTPDMQNLMAGLIAFERENPALGAKVQPIFITVDPDRDTPAILKQFVSAFHPRLIGLTGSAEQIAATAKSFAIYYAKVDGGTADSYLMSHSQTPYLMGPDGKPLALLPADDGRTDENEGSATAVAAELAKWVH